MLLIVRNIVDCMKCCWLYAHNVKKSKRRKKKRTRKVSACNFTKVTLLYGCFSHFFMVKVAPNRKASHMLLTDFKKQPLTSERNPTRKNDSIKSKIGTTELWVFIFDINPTTVSLTKIVKSLLPQIRYIFSNQGV